MQAHRDSLRGAFAVGKPTVCADIQLILPWLDDFNVKSGLSQNGKFKKLPRRDRRKDFTRSLFQKMPVLRGYTVPRFRGSGVVEIDGEEVHILDVPTEGRLPHAKVKVRWQDTLHGNDKLLVDIENFK